MKPIHFLLLVFGLILLMATLGVVDATAISTTNTSYIVLTLDHDATPSTLTNFPIYVHLDTSSGTNNEDVSAIFNEIGNNYYKMAVYTAGNVTECYVEVEKWDAAGEDAVLWVKVPSFSHTADTKLYLYFNGSEADNTGYIGVAGESAAENVWDANYVFVSHMNVATVGTVGELTDSTSNDHDGEAGGAAYAPALTPGKLGYAEDFDGINDFVQIPDDDAFSVITNNALTVSCWISPDNLNPYPAADAYVRWGGKGTSGTNQEWQLVYYNANHTYRPQRVSNYAYNNTGGHGAGDYYQIPMSIGEWVYVTAAWWETAPFDAQHGDEYIYHNVASTYGISDQWEEPAYDITYQNGNAYVHFGNQYTGGGQWNGKIDEIRISNIVRSDAWVNASYYADSDLVISYDYTFVPEEEPTEPPAPTPTPAPPAGTPTPYPGATTMAEPGVDYGFWLGPTMPAGAVPHLVDNSSYGLVIAALMGNDIRNATLSNFSGERIIGGLTWPYNAVPGLFLMFVGFILGIIMYIKLDGELLIPGGILIVTGLLSAGSSWAFQVPWEMIAFCTFAIVLGFAAILYQLVIARGD